MDSPPTDPWPDLLRQTLRSYDEPLLRQVAAKLCKPRSQWTVAVLLDRCLEVLGNPAAIDRRLKELEPSARQVLSLIGHSRQPCWPVGSLVEMAVALGHVDGLAPVQALLENGLLYPVHPTPGRIKQFEHWLGLAPRPQVQVPPLVTQRALGEPLPLVCPGQTRVTDTPREADGLDWPLRLAVLDQRLAGMPLRRTQQGDLFKRDLDRLRDDSLLGAAPSDALIDLPDPGLFTAALALAASFIEERDGDLCAVESTPAPWAAELPALLLHLVAALPRIESWNAAHGWSPGADPGNPYPAAQLLALVALGSLPEGTWARPEAIDAWLRTHHPFWSAQEQRRDGSSSPRRTAAMKPPADVTGIVRFLLGIAYTLRLLQACKDADGAWVVRLSALGRWALGVAETPTPAPTFPQTLLVQPNLEILAYRQGLTPELIARLTRIATWKTVGAACTLQLEPQSVYRALESGETLTSIVQILERHGMKELPMPVLEALKTWSNKRDRLTIYPAALLLEFPTPSDLNEALARGLPAVRLTDRMAAVASEQSIDYKHFRLTGTRDYCLPPEPCVDVEADGVTLSVDLARSDLLLETEMQRFAEPVSGASAPGRRVYQLTPASLASARAQALTIGALAAWFEQRTGLPLSAAARLQFTGSENPPAELNRRLVLQVASEVVADGLLQWPATASLIATRLGPCALAVEQSNAAKLRERLEEIGLGVLYEGDAEG